jgi:glutamyl-tRNA synthetase
MDILKDINKKHMQIMDATELSRYVGFADAEIGELARIYLQEAATTRELKEKIAPIFSPREIPDAYKEEVMQMKEAIIKAPYFDEYADFKEYVIAETGLKDEAFTTSLRLLLTNAQSGPDIADIYKYLKNYIGEIIK